jgi:hypothetical protein
MFVCTPRAGVHLFNGYDRRLSSDMRRFPKQEPTLRCGPNVILAAHECFPRLRHRSRDETAYIYPAQSLAKCLETLSVRTLDNILLIEPPLSITLRRRIARSSMLPPNGSIPSRPRYNGRCRTSRKCHCRDRSVRQGRITLLSIPQ